MMKINHKMCLMAVVAFVMTATVASAQKYQNGIIDKTIAVVGNEMVTISQLEEVQMMRAYGMMSDKAGRCGILEQMMVSKLFLMQARVDSIAVNNDMVESELRNRIDNVRTQLGGDEGVEEYFRDGVTLRDGYECKSAFIELASDRMSGFITLTEGKYHQIKRMVAASDNRVMSLARVKFAGIGLDPLLAPGEWRMLTDAETGLLRDSI